MEADETLKNDSLGSIERCTVGDGVPASRRVARGRGPVFDVVARMLLARERRALERLDGLDGVPHVVVHAPLDDQRRVLLRSWIEGEPLWCATALPRDFFTHLERLVSALHARGVCHNDLHKEQNVLVRPDGRPAVIDFQLASLHERPSRAFDVRVREDLRHVAKHRSRYERRGARKTAEERAAEPRRSLVALSWRRYGKPVYRALVGLFPRLSEPEPRRPSTGPWPEWSAPLGASDPIAPARKFESNA